MKYLIGLYLILNPLFFIYGIELRVAQEMCYQISSMVLILASMFFENKRVERSETNIWIGIGGLWILTIYVLHSLGWSIMFNTILGIGVYFAVIRTLNKDDFKLIVKVIAYITGFALLYMAIQFVGFDIRDQNVINAPGAVPKCAFFGLKAAMGEYFAIALPLVLSFSWVAVLFLVPIALSYSSVSVLGALVGIMFFFWFRKRLFFWILIPVILLSGAFYGFKMEDHNMMGSRIPMWGMVLQDSFRKPLGRGLDSFRNDDKIGARRYYKHSYDHGTVRAIKMEKGWAIPKVDQKFLEQQEQGSPLDYWDHPHNEYLLILYETGFPGLFIVGFIFLIPPSGKRSGVGVGVDTLVGSCANCCKACFCQLAAPPPPGDVAAS